MKSNHLPEANTYICEEPTHSYSCPLTFRHANTPLQTLMREWGYPLGENSNQTNRKEGPETDKDYVPPNEGDQDESSLGSSYASEPSSSYDPLHNMEAYLRMRDQL